MLIVLWTLFAFKSRIFVCQFTYSLIHARRKGVVDQLRRWRTNFADSLWAIALWVSKVHKFLNGRCPDFNNARRLFQSAINKPLTKENTPFKWLRRRHCIRLTDFDIKPINGSYLLLICSLAFEGAVWFYYFSCLSNQAALLSSLERFNLCTTPQIITMFVFLTLAHCISLT